MWKLWNVRCNLQSSVLSFFPACQKIECQWHFNSSTTTITTTPPHATPQKNGNEQLHWQNCRPVPATWMYTGESVGDKWFLTNGQSDTWLTQHLVHAMKSQQLNYSSLPQNKNVLLMFSSVHSLIDVCIFVFIPHAFNPLNNLRVSTCGHLISCHINILSLPLFLVWHFVVQPSVGIVYKNFVENMYRRILETMLKLKFKKYKISSEQTKMPRFFFPCPI